MPQLLPGSGEEDRHQYPAGAAHHHRQAFADQREERWQIVQGQLLTLEPLGNFARPGGEGGAGIAVAYFGIQRVEMFFKIDEGAGHLRHVIAHLWVGRGRKIHPGAVEGGRHDVDSPRLHRLLPAGGFHIRKQRFLNTLLQHDGGQREAFHIQRRHQRGRAY